MLFMVGIFSAEAIQSFAFFNYPFNIVVFIVGGGVCHSCPGFRLPSYNACVFGCTARYMQIQMQIHHLLFCCISEKEFAQRV